MANSKMIPTIVMLSVSVLFLIACGTAGPVGYESQPDNNAATPSEPQPAAIPTNEAFEKPERESAAAPAADMSGLGQIIEESVVFDGDIQVGFTIDGRAFRGDPDAPIIIEEFSDFQCPYCTRFTQETLSALDSNQIANGEVVIVFHDFPLESIHPQAFAAANAARCAGAQDAIAYWDMHDLLFSSAQQWSVANPHPIFSRFAEELNLDIEAYNNCLEENQYQEQINADLAFGAQRGVRSTPSFFINGQPVIGAQPVGVFDQAIEAVRSGESIAAEQPDPSEAELPLEAPRVAPTPAAIQGDNAAFKFGNPDAPVTIVEYTDYQCPFCQRHVLETMPGIMSEMIETGRVQYVLKDLPLDNLHPEARTAALAARCAGEQDAYWPMHDAIFENQSDWAGQGDAASDILVSIAAELDLDQEALSSCIEDKRYTDVIQENVEEAQALGASATPYFFIDGMPIPGAQAYELFVYAVELAEVGLLTDAYEPGEPDVSESYALGDPDAPVVIIEYTDFQCPYCERHFEQTYSQIKEQFIDKGLVYYIFKDFPLTNIHPQALKAAEAARCAGDQEAYVQMHDKLFASQSEWSGKTNVNEIFVGYAEALALNLDSFSSCLENGQYESAVLQDLDEGSQLGINGTPAFFINGHSMSGAQPFQVFEQAINQFLVES